MIDCCIFYTPALLLLLLLLLVLLLLYLHNLILKINMSLGKKLCKQSAIHLEKHMDRKCNNACFCQISSWDIFCVLRKNI
jgi:hypothetical protein